MRRSSPLLDRRNERGQPRTTVLVEIDSEGVLVHPARSRAAIAQEALELPALPAVLDPDQQLPACRAGAFLTPADSRARPARSSCAATRWWSRSRIRTQESAPHVP